MANEEPPNVPPRRVEAGPTVQTSDLYRDPNATTEQIPAASTTPPPGDATINPMSTASATGVMPTAEPLAPAVPQRGWRTSVVFFVIFLVTTGVGLVDMYFHREFTYWTGAAFILMCLLCAIKVRPMDLWTAVICPPIAYLLALVVAGQPTTFPGGGSLLLRELTLLATGLAFNAPYIYGGTLVALIVVLIRRPKIRRAQAN